jgi:hypothetical protein
VDFDRINAGEIRFSVGAVNVGTGNFVYFDNTTHVIGPEHVITSGALPPGFPAIEIEGEHYWDGGLVSNTPLQWVLESEPRRDTLAFQVDLWNARGAFPRTTAEVSTRQKEIQYSSRTRANSDRFKHIQTLRNALSSLLEKLPEDLKHSPELAVLRPAADHKVYNLVQLIPGPRTMRETRRTTSSRARTWRTIGAPATTTPCAPCAIRRCSSAPRASRASSPPTLLRTAANDGVRAPGIAFQAVIDDPHPHPARLVPSIAFGRIDAAQIGAVGQTLVTSQTQVLLDPPEKIGTAIACLSP